MFRRVVIVVGLRNLVFVIDNDANAIDIFRLPDNRYGVHLSGIDTVHANDVEGRLVRPGKEGDLELRGGVPACVVDRRRDVDVRTGCDVVVAHHDVLDTEFGANRTQPDPLALEVNVVRGQFWNRAGFGVRHHGELVAGSVVAGHVEANEITGLGVDGPPGRDVDHTGPHHVLPVLLHAQQRGACTDGHGSGGVPHDPVDDLLGAGQVSVFRALEFDFNLGKVVRRRDVDDVERCDAPSHARCSIVHHNLECGRHQRPRHVLATAGNVRDGDQAGSRRRGLERQRRRERHFDGVAAVAGQRTVGPEFLPVKDFDENTNVPRCWGLAALVDHAAGEGQAVVLSNTAAVGYRTCTWFADVFHRKVGR